MNPEIIAERKAADVLSNSTAVIDGEISMSKGASLWGHSLSELRRLVATLI